MKRMIRDNVERIVATEEQAAKLKKEGFKELPGKIEVNDEAEPAGPRTLETMTVPELKELAKEKGLEGYSSLTKAELLELLKDVV